MRRRGIHVASLAGLVIIGATLLALAPPPGALAEDDVGTPDPPFAGVAPASAIKEDVTGRYGGKLVLALSNDPGTWNPITSKGASDQEYSQLLFASLTGYHNEKWENTFELAESFDRSEDGLVWTYHLRKGIKWSDGEPFDADDVVFTFTVINDPEIATANKDLFKVDDSPLPKWEKVDQYTVRATLSKLDVLFDENVGSCRIIPEHKLGEAYRSGKFMQSWGLGEDLSNIVGLGPFRLVDYKSGERAVFERNPHYWRIDRDGNRLPYLDQVVMVIVPDQNVLYTKFVAGDLSTIEPLRAEDFDDAKKQSIERGFTVEKVGLSLNTNCLTFNRNPGKNSEGKPYVEPHKLAWFNDKNFRKAVAFACDRQSMVRSVLDGRGKPIYGRVPPSNKQWFVKGKQEYKYNLEKAKELLESNGYQDRDGDGWREDAKGNKLAFILNTNSENTTRIKVCSIIKEDLKKVGIDVTVAPVTFIQLVTTLRDTFDFDAYVLGWASGVPPDPLMSKNLLLSSGRVHPGWPQQPEPSTAWEGRVDNLVAKMAQTLDPKDRVEINSEIETVWRDELPEIYLFSSNLYVAAYNNVGNWRPTLLRPHNWWNIYELYIKKD